MSFSIDFDQANIRQLKRIEGSYFYLNRIDVRLNIGKTIRFLQCGPSRTMPWNSKQGSATFV